MPFFSTLLGTHGCIMAYSPDDYLYPMSVYDYGLWPKHAVKNGHSRTWPIHEFESWWYFKR